MRTVLAGLLLFALTATLRAEFTLSQGGKPQSVILWQTGATATESNAVHELALALEKLTGAAFPIQGYPAAGSHASVTGVGIPERAIIVGPGAAARALFPEVPLDEFGPEEFVIRVKSGRLLLAGGRARGTFYAVWRFLQDYCGVRWWTPWAATFPSQPSLRVPDLNVHTQPVFEYREPYWYSGFEPHWKARNQANGESSRIPDAFGGCIKYKGYCHTFYPLVPPDKHFATHPEWYSLLKGKRTHERAQLCLSNPELRDFVVQRVKEWLREAPDAQIISVTQNDWQGACECANCKAIDQAEGSPSGSMLAFVNYIAEKIEPEYPQVAVDTFAYLYTRRPPKTIRPRHNVIVRLCSIECNFREPWDHPSNASFLADLAGWSKLCSRLYVWDYVTEFGHYVQPHPNWFTLGPNVRLFQQYGVKGVFEEGAYAGQGAEMAEMRAWVLAQLLWNPQQDDRALIREFLHGYYGKAASDIEQYLELMHRASQGFDLGCYLRKEPPHLRFQTLSAAEHLWQAAEAAAARQKDPEVLMRVRLARLPVRYASLSRWQSLRRQCWEQNGTWPWPQSRRAAADQFRTVCQGLPGKDWSCVKVLSEKGLSVEDFLKTLAIDPPDTNSPTPPKRLLHPPPPADLPGLSRRSCIDLQDNLAGLYKPGEYADIRPDPAASDLRAVWMPGSHAEWAFRIPGKALPERAQHGSWKVYAVIRVEKAPGAPPDAVAFSAGVYDTKARTYPAELKPRLRDVGEGYHAYLLGTMETTPDRDLWVAPPANASVRALYVDRLYLVPAQ